LNIKNKAVRKKFESGVNFEDTISHKSFEDNYESEQSIPDFEEYKERQTMHTKEHN
jgi:hypothetical protein